MSGNTNSTSSGTGAITTSGGIGAAGNIYSASSFVASSGVYSAGQTSGIGYTTGAGGTVTQATSKVTPVTVNKVCGTITTAADSLAATTAATFTVTNAAVTINDVIVVNLRSGYTNHSDYEVTVGGNAASTFVVTIYNRTAAPLAQALVLNYVVLKSVVA